MISRPIWGIRSSGDRERRPGMGATTADRSDLVAVFRRVVALYRRCVVARRSAGAGTSTVSGGRTGETRLAAAGGLAITSDCGPPSCAAAGSGGAHRRSCCRGTPSASGSEQNRGACRRSAPRRSRRWRDGRVARASSGNGSNRSEEMFAPRHFADRDTDETSKKGPPGGTLRRGGRRPGRRTDTCRRDQGRSREEDPEEAALPGRSFRLPPGRRSLRFRGLRIFLPAVRGASAFLARRERSSPTPAGGANRLF